VFIVTLHTYLNSNCYKPENKRNTVQYINCGHQKYFNLFAVNYIP